MAQNAGLQSFAALLKKYRRASGLSQMELAERAGLSRNGLSDLERGLRHPRRDTSDLLVKALALDANDTKIFQASIQAARVQPPVKVAEVPNQDEASPLLGREREMSIITSFLGLPANSLCLIRGGLGIGKSRLLAEAGKAGRAGAWSVLDYPASSLRPVSAADLVRKLLGRSAMPSKYARLCTGQIDWTELVPLLRELAGPAGLLLLLDGLSWFNPEALSLIHRLVAGDFMPRVACVATLDHFGAIQNPELGALLQDSQSRRRTVILDLDALDRVASYDLAIALAGDFDLGLSGEQLFEASQGIPSMIFLAVDRARNRNDAQWVAQSVSQAWELFPEGAKTVIGLAALADEALTPTVFYHCGEQLGHGQKATQEHIDTAQAEHWILEQDGRYRCMSVIRDQIGNLISHARKVLYHKVLADHYRAIPLITAQMAAAGHYEAAGLREPAQECWLAAGDGLEKENDPEQAHRCYLQAVALSDLSQYQPGLFHATLKVIRHLNRQKNFMEAMHLAEQAIQSLQKARRIEEQLLFYEHLMQSYFIQGQGAEALQRVGSFALLAENLPPSDPLVRFFARLTMAYSRARDFPNMDRCMKIMESKFPPDISQDTKLMSYMEMQRVYNISGQFRKSIDLITTKSLPLAEAMADTGSQAIALRNLVNILQTVGRFAEAERYLVRLRSMSDPFQSPQAQPFQAYLELRQLDHYGRWDEAMVGVQAFRGLTETIVYQSSILILGYHITWNRGDFVQAERILEEAQSKMGQSFLAEHHRFLAGETAFFKLDLESAAAAMSFLVDDPRDGYKVISEYHALHAAIQALQAQTSSEAQRFLENLEARIGDARESDQVPALFSCLSYKIWALYCLDDLAGASHDLPELAKWADYLDGTLFSAINLVLQSLPMPPDQAREWRRLAAAILAKQGIKRPWFADETLFRT